MKVGIEAQRIFRARKHGMDVVALELIRRLQAAGRPGDRYELFAAKGPDTSCIANTTNLRINTLSALSYADWEQLALPRAARSLRPDILHCTANTAPLYCPVPLVLTLHDIIYLETTSFKGSSYQNLGNLYRRWIVPPAIKKARKIITVSEYERKVIVAKFPEAAQKITVIYNGVDKKFNANYSAEQAAAFRLKYKLPAEFILFLGNTAPKKNTANVVKAYVHYCEQEAYPLPIVITDLDRHHVEKLLSEWKKTGLPGSFVFPGYVPGDDMPLLYRSSSLFLYPSLRESFGLPILEAMACGVPVITSRTTAMPEVAGDAALLVDPENAEEIARGIRQLLSDDALCASLRQSGYARAQRFSWEDAASQLQEVYQMTSMESP